jgi:hypothetical protein
MTQPSENKAVTSWETEMKLRSQVHMAVRLCTNLVNLEEALGVLKSEHVEKKTRRGKKTLAASPDDE